LVLAVVATIVNLLVIGHLSNYRSPDSPYTLRNWLSPDTYTAEGQKRLLRLLPWIVVLGAVELIGATTFLAHVIGF
jgi:hypothetical protein